MDTRQLGCHVYRHTKKTGDGAAVESHRPGDRPRRCVLHAARERIRETLSTACRILASVARRIQPTATLRLDGKQGPRIEFSYRLTEY